MKAHCATCTVISVPIQGIAEASTINVSLQNTHAAEDLGDLGNLKDILKKKIRYRILRDQVLNTVFLWLKPEDRLQSSLHIYFQNSG